ncbi:phage tail protein [Alcanivorax sp.]|uniref:phage tail protein n=1 Tax=Alcanivorax sp. TaxID=1872427 RepID=UPI003A938D47
MIPRMDNPINGYLLRDKRGNLLPGGRLEFFDDQTDLPEVVWDAGSGQTVSLGSVVYADAYGLLPDFELTPNLDYRLRCYNSDDDFMWDRGGVANNVSDLLERVEALEAAVEALGEDSGPKNLLTNGSCKAVRHLSPGLTYPVRSTFSQGELAGVFARVPNATEGAFKRVLNAGFGSVGVHAQLDDVTTNNSESEAGIQWRMPSGDGAAISGDPVVFSVKASQNSGGAINAHLTLYKCLTVDDFSNLVEVAASSPVSLASGVTTQLTLPVENTGDVSTGVAVVVTFDCGIVSNTNFIAGEAQLERGLVATQFEDRPQLIDQAAWAAEDLEGVGELKWFPAVSAPPGHVIADGTELNRADYPRLWAWANAYGRIVDDTTWADDNPGCFSSGDNSLTFRLPDLITNEPFVRSHAPGGSRDQGSYQSDAIQDFEGEVNVPNGTSASGESYFNPTGSFSFEGFSSSTGNTGGGGNGGRIKFDPKTSEVRTDPDETRPKNITLLPCIKY